MRSADPNISFTVLKQDVDVAVATKLFFLRKRCAFCIDAQNAAVSPHPNDRITIPPQAQNLYVAERGRQGLATIIFVVPMEYAIVGADQQILLANGQKAIDLSFRE